MLHQRVLSRRQTLAGLSLLPAFSRVSLARPLQNQSAPSEVDVHAILATDVSNSVSEKEFGDQMRGYAEALRSEEAVDHFDSGLHYALSAVFFGSTCMHKVTRIVKSSAAASEFAHDVFFDGEKNIPRQRPDVGTSTNIASVYQMAAQLYKDEKDETERSFHSQNRSVVISGDGTHSTALYKPLQEWADILAVEHGATVHGVAILDGTSDIYNNQGRLEEWFRTHIPTRRGLRFNGESELKEIRPGQVIGARSFKDMLPAVQLALRYRVT